MDRDRSKLVGSGGRSHSQLFLWSADDVVDALGTTHAASLEANYALRGHKGRITDVAFLSLTSVLVTTSCVF